MGGHPMPAVVEKGPFPRGLDLRYLDIEARKTALKNLKAHQNDFIAAAKAGGIMPQPLEQDFETDWFGDNNWFVTIDFPYTPGGEIDPDVDADIGPMPPANAKAAKVLITRALIEALEISLGLNDGEDPPESGPPRRNRTVQLYWVCGKAAGFDAQVSWIDFVPPETELLPPAPEWAVIIGPDTFTAGAKRPKPPFGVQGNDFQEPLYPVGGARGASTGWFRNLRHWFAGIARGAAGRIDTISTGNTTPVDGVVSVFIVTPPIKNSAHDLYFNLSDGFRQTVKVNGWRGMVLMRSGPPDANGVATVTKRLMSAFDGGVTNPDRPPG